MNKTSEQNPGIGKSDPAKATPQSGDRKQNPRDSAQDSASPAMPRDAIKDPAKDAAKTPLQAGKSTGDGASQ